MHLHEREVMPRVVVAEIGGNGKRYKVERAYTEAREMYELNCSEYREAADNEHKQSPKA